jgi:hypothetical protein
MVRGRVRVRGEMRKREKTYMFDKMVGSYT